MITLEAMGLAEAADACDELAAALSEYTGCFYRGSKRADSDKRNADIVTYLADGDPRRDLRTMSDTAAAEMGQQFITEMLKAMHSMYKKRGGLKKNYARKPDYARAKIQAARAWRAVGKNYLNRMHMRIPAQVSADEQGNESQAAPVGAAYAKKRAEKYGVSETMVYMATGQLYEDLYPEDGRIALVKGGAAIARLEAAAEVAAAGKAITGALGLGRGL